MDWTQTIIKRMRPIVSLDSVVPCFIHSFIQPSSPSIIASASLPSFPFPFTNTMAQNTDTLVYLDIEIGDQELKATSWDL